MSGTERLVDRLARLARSWQTAATTAQAQRSVTRAAVDTVAGCDHASISLISRHGAVITVAATGDLPERVDEIQYATGQGPGLDAIRSHLWRRLPDFETDVTWPAFSRRAVQLTAVRSMVSLRLFTGDDVIGALNLYSTTAYAFGAQAIATACLFATHAAIALDAARDRQVCGELQAAVQSNREIGMALGIAMATLRVTPQQALELLRTVSRRSNRRLHEIALDVVETGQLPEVPAAENRPARR